ncbi:pyridoxal-phosphate dependent enzyme [Bradyrhizobium sp. 137]|uniref:pyridoxal-phosphate dependent enzyme n=1 Tax=Bradyrhizobium sp. 137 TaxID=2782614 RepID=UPI00201C4EF5|nr:pyridoxal-phosphate dependent enzyme [Bradyrhizobium sp. 137]
MTVSALENIAALACIRCARRYPAGSVIDSRGCPACRAVAPSNLQVVYCEGSLTARRWPGGAGQRWSRFEGFLPVSAAEIVSLGEETTPLVLGQRIGESIKCPQLFFKQESRNPTWSHKDRFSFVAVSHARKIGARTVATASTGNAGASLAAYAAKAGLPCVVLTSQAASGLMTEQIKRYGAMVVPLPEGRQRWPVLEEGVRRLGWYATSPFAAPVIGSHPVGIEGYKTIAYEIYEQLGDKVPDWIVVPTAYGDVLAGIFRGFQDLVDLGLAANTPKLVAAEIYGSLAHSLGQAGDAVAEVERDHDTRAISIWCVQSSFQALQALRASGGQAVRVGDNDLINLQNELARTEGILGELSSVTALAATRELRERGDIKADDTVICLLTASGMKDLDLTAVPDRSVPRLEGNLSSALSYLEEKYGDVP